MSDGNAIFMCNHIGHVYNDYKKQLTQCFSLFVFPTTGKARLMKSRLLCFECGKNGFRLVVCALCPHVTCAKCFRPHAEEKKHVIAVHLTNGATRCYACNDIVYHTSIEENVIQNKYNLVDNRDLQSVELLSGKNTNFLKTMRPKVMSSMAGYRGLVNLGNSCYMNVIIQALVHTPVLSRFLMSGVHACPNTEQSLECLTCELSRLCQEMYSDAPEPIAPARFLKLVWKRLGFATPNTMQDAHELYISLVERMHNDLAGGLWPENALCPCVVDGVFSGQWLSTRECTNCHQKSSRTELYRDLAIDLSGLRSAPHNHLLSAEEMADLSIDGLDFPLAAVNEPDSDTLNDCLNWFMRREPITFTCENCHSKQCVKQFSPWQPPCALVIQLKRFENVLEKPKRNERTCVSFTEEIALRDIAKYVLYCAVVHTGSNNGKNSVGHYFCYVRGPNSWIRMNDDEMTVVSEQVVFSSNAYLLFYQQVRKR